MSEVTYINCDGTGCDERITKIKYDTDGEKLGWTKDDMDADFCPACTQAATDLEATKASPEELAQFGETVNAEADKVLPPVVFDEEFERQVAAIEKKLRKDLKKEGQSKEMIEETIRLFREQAPSLRRAP